MNKDLIQRRINIEKITTRLFQKYKKSNKKLKWPKNSLGEVISISPRYLLDTVKLDNRDKLSVEAFAKEYAELSCKIHKVCVEDQEREEIKYSVINLIKLNSAIEDFREVYELTQFGRSKKQVDDCLFVYIRDNMFNIDKDEFRENLMFELECYLGDDDIEELNSLLFRYFKLSKKMHFIVK